VEERWELIQKAARGTKDNPGSWQAASWSLERTFPREFSRPEFRLGVAVNNVNASANGNAFQTIVLTDLEFAGLRKNPSYLHRASEFRDVESEVVVDPDLSGTLVRSDHPNGAVISESQEKATRRRVAKASAKIDALLKAKRNGGPAIPEPGAGQKGGRNSAPSEAPALPTNAMILMPITMPEGEPGLGWWRQ
jgi:hypothetical protein